MRIRELLTMKLGIEDPLLRQKSEPVKTIDGLAREIAEFMVLQMSQEYDGLKPAGFAAPQFGELVRIIVVKRDSLTNVVIVNPEIVYEKGRLVEPEQCLSIPNRAFIVRRPQILKCRGLNLNGGVVTLKGRDTLARVLKHEIDHLDGILIDAIAERKLY